MDISRKANRESLEKTLQYRSRQDILSVSEIVEEKLVQLQVLVTQLSQTPHGRAELASRSKLFGPCQQSESETGEEFYGRLRRWIDRDLPRTKSPLHAPRQTND